MTTYYTQSSTGSFRPSASVTGQTLNTLCHFASAETDNSIYRDEVIDIDIQLALALTPVAGAPINTYILYAMNGTNYEDGIPGTNNGTAAASPAPNPGSLIDSHGVLASTGVQKWTIKDIPILSYKYRVEHYNGTTKSASGVLLTTLVYGRHGEIIG
jgi:hypothetical protein